MDNKIKIIDTIRKICQSEPGVYEARPFGNIPICYKVSGKIFAELYPDKSFYKITLKCTPELSSLYRDIYNGIVETGYHCPTVQKPYWYTVDLYKFDDMDKLTEMIREAYDTVILGLSKRMQGEITKYTKYKYKYTNGSDKDFIKLAMELDDELNRIVGGENNRKQYIKYNFLNSIDTAIVVYDKNIPIACCGFRKYDLEHAELKRMYVDENYRNNGIAKELVRRIEAEAKMDGSKWMLLETGYILKEACSVYKKSKYKVIENYGPYVDMKDSVCMEKKI